MSLCFRDWSRGCLKRTGRESIEMEYEDSYSLIIFIGAPDVIVNVSGFLANIESPFYSGCSFGLLPSRLASKLCLLGHPQGHRPLSNTQIVRTPLFYCDIFTFFLNVFIQVILILTSPAKHRTFKCGGVCPMIVPWSTIFSLLTVDISLIVSASTILPKYVSAGKLNSCGVRFRIHTGTCICYFLTPTYFPFNLST